MKTPNLDSKFKAIVFDFDNTLFDYEKTEEFAIEQVLKTLKIEFKREYVNIFQRINREVWEQTESGNFDKVNLRILRFERFFNKIGVDSYDGLVKNASEIFIRACERGFVIEGVYETLKQLKEHGYFLGIASAGLTVPRKAKLENSVINQFFDCALFREDFKNDKIKPHPDFYFEIAKKYNFSNDEILYVGDTFSSDVKGAKLAGIANVWFNFFKVDQSSVEMQYCDNVIYDFSQLLNILKIKETKMIVDKEYEYLYKIPGNENFASAKPVGGGWSADVKFKVTTKDGTKYLLRVCDASLKAKKEAEFEVLKMLQPLNFNYSKPLAFGEIEEYGKVYMLLSWMEGENVEIMMPKLSAEKQYQCGLEAGRILRKMHSIPSDGSIDAWRNKNLKKLHERLELYKDCNGYKIEHLDEMVAFIQNNLHLTENRPMTFLHGDYQGRNIVVDEDCNVGAIDFERTAYGDPYEEFNRMMTYTRRWSVEFCRGQVDGYFEGEQIPENFWQIVAFHCALNLITTIVFGVHTKQKHIYEENEIAKQVIYDDFKGYTCFPPDWFVNRK